MTGNAQELPEWLNVSRETHTKLQEILGLVERWNRTINLVSAGSLGQGWTWHVLDFAQLWSIGNAVDGPWVDIGSGGGFPGLVIAAIAQEQRPALQVVLVEFDRRKCVFLTEVARQLCLDVVVRTGRVEALTSAAAQVLSARALAPLDALLISARRHLAPGGLALFPKGQSFELELEAARAHWHFDCEVIKSRTDPLAVILRIENIEHV